VTVLRDGRVCFAEQYSDAVRCVGADGVIRTVLGGGTKTIGVDPQPATDVVLSRPTALAEGPDGSLYATSEGTGTIVRLDPGGKVETCVGGGSDSGESVPARRTNLLLPRGITVGPDGTMYIAEQGRNRVRRVDPSGLVTTFAGSGDPGAGGDGGPAASATFRGPTAVALDIEGALYVADQGNLRIRRVDRGRVQAYAGGGDRTALEGSSGRLASISTRTLAVGPDGTLYATEESLYRVVSLRSPFPGTASGETLLPNEAGSEIFVFDSKGRHLRTLDGLTYSPRSHVHVRRAGPPLQARGQAPKRAHPSCATAAAAPRKSRVRSATLRASPTTVRATWPRSPTCSDARSASSTPQVVCSRSAPTRAAAFTP
jgi:streptogramin lyase